MDLFVDFRLYICFIGLEEKRNMFYVVLYLYFLLEYIYLNLIFDINFYKEKLYLIVFLFFYINLL